MSSIINLRFNALSTRKRESKAPCAIRIYCQMIVVQIIIIALLAFALVCCFLASLCLWCIDNGLEEIRRKHSHKGTTTAVCWTGKLKFIKPSYHDGSRKDNVVKQFFKSNLRLPSICYFSQIPLLSFLYVFSTRQTINNNLDGRYPPRTIYINFITG